MDRPGVNDTTQRLSALGSSYRPLPRLSTPTELSGTLGGKGCASGGSEEHPAVPEEKGRAALGHARRGRAVFPCEEGGKKPLTPHGFKDATTDEEQIRRWWKSYPDANIGSPTGEVSGTLAVDHDLYKPEALTPEELERKLGPLSSTGVAIETGGGGRQYLFCYPEGSNIRNTTDLLPGVDIRGEGGYIVLPPSTTQGTYRYLDNRTLTDPPAPLVERLTEPKRTSSRGTGGTSEATPTTSDEGGPPIGEGCRDDTLTRIAGRLHDGTRTPDDLTSDLLAINEARCKPPLPQHEVKKIARSIHPRKPCKRSPQTPGPEVLEILDEIEEVLWRIGWRGMGELSARDVYVALIVLARRYGSKIPAGVRVSISIRALALKAAVSKPTVIKAIRRLRKAGLIRKDDADRTGTQAGAFVLLAPRANVDHSSTAESIRGAEQASGKTLRAPRLRWSAPRFDRVGNEYIRTTIKRLGKGCGAVIDALERAGGSATVEELADTLHKARIRDLRRRVIARLEATGVVECSGNSVSLAADWLEVLGQERMLSGEIEAHRRDMQRYAREREAYTGRARAKLRRGRAHVSRPSADSLAAVKSSREKRHAYLDAYDAGDTAQDTPPDAELVARHRRVERLVRQGMRLRFAEQEVCGSAAGCAPRSDPPPDPPDEAGARKMPRMVEGVYVHGAMCGCEWCVA